LCEFEETSKKLHEFEEIQGKAEAGAEEFLF
jgi:hypothetical protein